MTGTREIFGLLLPIPVYVCLAFAWVSGTILAAARVTESNPNLVFAAMVGIIAAQMLIPAIYFGVRDMRAGK